MALTDGRWHLDTAGFGAEVAGSHPVLLGGFGNLGRAAAKIAPPLVGHSALI